MTTNVSKSKSNTKRKSKSSEEQIRQMLTATNVSKLKKKHERTNSSNLNFQRLPICQNAGKN